MPHSRPSIGFRTNLRKSRKHLRAPCRATPLELELELPARLFRELTDDKRLYSGRKENGEDEQRFERLRDREGTEIAQDLREDK
jgi:hypothetical protein